MGVETAAIDRRRGRWWVLLAIAILVTLAAAPPAGAFIYWVDNKDFTTATIGRANLDGSGIDRNFITGLQDPCGVAVDAQHIYWADRETNSIGRADLDGSGVEPSFIPNGAGVGFPCGPAVDSSRIWWANFLGGGGNEGSIARASIDGSGLQATFFDSPGSVASPTAVALAGGFVFWSNSDLNGAGPQNPTVGRAGVEGTPPPNVNFLDTGGLAPDWLAADDSHLYISTHFGFFGGGPAGIARSDLDGNGLEEVTRADSTGGLAVHGGQVYWANRIEGTLSRANPDGTNPDFAFVTHLGSPLGLAVDGGVPSNEFTFGKVTRDRRKGRASLEVTVASAGLLSLSGKRLKAGEVAAPDAGTQTLAVVPKGKLKRRLADKGKAKASVDVTFTPTGGARNTETTEVTLKRR